MKLTQLLDTLSGAIQDPSQGLPEEVFLFLSKITPLVNVDLLIKDDQGRTLLTWRDDEHHPPSWHVPGGIIRFQETLSHRVHTVAKDELGTDVEFNQHPISVNEVILPSRKIRGHFISFLYSCTLLSEPAQNMKYREGTPKAGQWAWHHGCPNPFIPVQEIYRPFISGDTTAIQGVLK